MLTFLVRYILCLQDLSAHVATLRTPAPEDVNSLPYRNWDDSCNIAARAIQTAADVYLKKRRKAQVLQEFRAACSAATAGNLPHPKQPSAAVTSSLTKTGGRPCTTTITAMDNRLSGLGGIDKAVGKGKNVVKVDSEWIKKTDTEVDAILGKDGANDDEEDED